MRRMGSLIMQSADRLTICGRRFRLAIFKDEGPSATILKQRRMQPLPVKNRISCLPRHEEPESTSWPTSNSHLMKKCLLMHMVFIGAICDGTALESFRVISGLIVVALAAWIGMLGILVSG
jgi:hypothetical protein